MDRFGKSVAMDNVAQWHNVEATHKGLDHVAAADKTKLGENRPEQAPSPWGHRRKPRSRHVRVTTMCGGRSAVAVRVRRG